MAARDFRVPMGPILRAFGVAATVTRPAPDDTPIETTGVWVPMDSVSVPQGSAWERRDRVRCLAFDIDAVPTLPRNTLIDAPERKGDEAQTWIVDGLADAHPKDRDQVKVLVRLYRDAVT